MDITFKDDSEFISVIGATITVACRKCGIQWGFRLNIYGKPPVGYDVCLSCAHKEHKNSTEGAIKNGN